MRTGLIAGALVAFLTMGHAANADAQNAKIFAVPVPAETVMVPELTEMSDRSYVSMGYYGPDGSPVMTAGHAAFVTLALLVPGMARIEDETKKLRPHLFELRLSDPARFHHETAVLAEIWDASGNGNAEYLAVAKYARQSGDGDEEPQFLGWMVYAIRGEPLPMNVVDFTILLALIPELEES